MIQTLSPILQSPEMEGFLQSWWAGSVAMVVFLHWKIFSDGASCQQWSRRIQKWSVGREYRKALNYGLGIVSKFFGKGLFTLRAFGSCLTIAFFYPILLFFLSWVFGGPSTIGQEGMMPDGWPWWARSLLLAVAGLYAYVCFITFRWIRKQGAFVVLIAVSFTIAVILGGAFYGKLAGVFAFAGVSAATFLVAVAGRVAGAFAVGFAIVFVVAFLLSGGEFGELDTFNIMVLIVLPVGNAVFDWVSLGVSRWLISKIADDGVSWIHTVFHILADGIAA